MSISGAGQQRTVLVGIVLLVIGLLSYGYYTQYVKYLDPCPLCLTQRFFYLLCGIFAFLALIRSCAIQWQKVLSILILLSSIGGFGTAARQVWLQQLPPEKVPECGPGLQFWLENMPFLKSLELLFKGDGNCAEVDWTFLGLSMAGWSLLMFGFLAACGIWLYGCRARLNR